MFLDQHLMRFVEIPRVRTVQASRRIGPVAAEGIGSESREELSGAGLVSRLAALERPNLANDADRERFAAINDFVRNVLDDSTATLEVSHDATELNVRRGDLALPLDYLGTGVSQVIISPRRRRSNGKLWCAWRNRRYISIRSCSAN